jgi:hypothetical protein
MENTVDISLIKEDLLYYYWLTKKLTLFPLTSVDGRKVEILDFGYRNDLSGPDFTNTKVKIDDIIWAGSTEMHVRSSDWSKHKHADDKAYKNVILHVVYEDDKPVIFSNDDLGLDIPTIELKANITTEIMEKYISFIKSDRWIPCMNQWKPSHADLIHFSLYGLAASRLEDKISHLSKLFDTVNQDWNELLYVMLMRYFGGPTNADIMERLAINLPFKTILKNKFDALRIEAMLFGFGGLLTKDVEEDEYYISLQTEYRLQKIKYGHIEIPSVSWKFGKMLPHGFPTIRLAQFAAFIAQVDDLHAKIIEMDKVEELIEVFMVDPHEYWKKHYRFGIISDEKPKPITKDMAYRLVINAVVPILFFYGKIRGEPYRCEQALDLLDSLPAESNAMITQWKKLYLKPKSSLDSQALIQLKLHKCDRKACLSCPVGMKMMET